MVVDYKLIGQRIKAKRIDKGFTQEDIADHLGISVSYVSRLERAVVKISLETLVKVASILEVTPAYLLDGTITTSDHYLQGELADVVSDFDPDKIRLLLEISQSIKAFSSDMNS